MLTFDTFSMRLLHETWFQLPLVNAAPKSKLQGSTLFNIEGFDGIHDHRLPNYRLGLNRCCHRSPYTEKQWGVPAHTLSAGLAKRFEVRNDAEVRLVRHSYQGLPVEGYAKMMQNLLDGIPTILNCDYLRYRASFGYKKLLIYTGPIDELFDYELGKL